MPLSFELCAECTFPMAEAVPTGLLMSGGQLVGIAATLVEGALVDAGRAPVDLDAEPELTPADELELTSFKKGEEGYLAMKSATEAKRADRLRATLHGVDAPRTNKRTVFVDDAVDVVELVRVVLDSFDPS